MKKWTAIPKALPGCLLAISLALLAACAGGTGDSETGRSAVLSIQVTDAKPLLPRGTEKVLVPIDEVLARKTGGGWGPLPLAKTPHVIDLLQFVGGKTPQLVPPVQLEPGKYTQVRLGRAEGAIPIQGVERPLLAPSENLKTEKNFEFQVIGGGAVELTVDFDLSRSIAAAGPGKYMLKPVLHLVRTREAAAVEGSIRAAAFGAAELAVVTVSRKNDQGDYGVYTLMEVEKEPPGPTGFRVFRLAPGRDYRVQVQIGGSPTYEEDVKGSDLPPGSAYRLGPV